MLMNDVTISWVKFDATNPDMGFDKRSPQYSCSVSTTNKTDADAWKKAGVNVKPKEENGKISYTATLKKKIFLDDSGKNNTKPPAVVDKQLQPIVDTNTIGNGSVGNAQVRMKPYTYNGKSGISVQLLALQITDLKEYQGSESLQFEAIDSDKDVI